MHLSKCAGVTWSCTSMDCVKACCLEMKKEELKPGQLWMTSLVCHDDVRQLHLLICHAYEPDAGRFDDCDPWWLTLSLSNVDVDCGYVGTVGFGDDDWTYELISDVDEKRTQSIR